MANKKEEISKWSVACASRSAPIQSRRKQIKEYEESKSNPEEEQS